MTTTTPQDHVLDDPAAEVHVDVEADDGAVVVLPRYRDDLDRIAAALAAPERLVVCLRTARWARAHPSRLGRLRAGRVNGGPMPNGLLTVAEVAELAGVTEATIYTYLYRNQMPAPDLRFGQSPVWRQETIEAWLATRKPRKRRR